MIALVGQTSTQRIQAMLQGVFSATVSWGETNGSGWGQTATHALQPMHACQTILKLTARSRFIGLDLSVLGVGIEILAQRLEQQRVLALDIALLEDGNPLLVELG